MTVISISAHTSLVSDQGFRLGSSASYTAVDTWFFSELCIFMFYNHPYYYYYLHFVVVVIMQVYKRKQKNLPNKMGPTGGI